MEQTVLESNSVISKGSKRSKTTKSERSKSSSDSVLSTKVDKYKLLQEEATLKVKLAYVEQEKVLEIERLKQEQKLEEFKLKRELELSRAKLRVCKETDNEQTPSLEEHLVNLPSESKGEGVKRFLQSLTVTTCANETNTSVQSQVHVSQTPVLTTTFTPKTTTCGLRASAPSFLPGSVTQSVFSVRHFEPELPLPIQTEAACTQAFSSAKTYPVVANSISGPSPIMSTVMNSPSSYQFVHPQGQVNSFCEGWEKVAALQRCMDKLTEANLEQSTVSKELFVSGQLPN